MYSLPPYGYGYRHPYYGHLYIGSSAGIAYPTWPQSESLTTWSTGDQSPPFFDTVDLTATASANDEESPTAATAGDCKSNPRKRKDDCMPLVMPVLEIVGPAQGNKKRKDPTYSYLVNST